MCSCSVGTLHLKFSLYVYIYYYNIQSHRVYNKREVLVQKCSKKKNAVLCKSYEHKTYHKLSHLFPRNVTSLLSLASL